MANWEYRGLYKNHNMEGIIELPNNSKLKVCDLTKEMPDFMKQADTLFIDPPCSQGNLRSFYTKNDMTCELTFTDFYIDLFKRITEIKPKHLFVEVFKSNYDVFYNEFKDKFKNIIIYDSFYYNKKSNKCWIFHCSNEEIQLNEKMNNIDEEKVIRYITTNHNYNCIGDLCMGTGLVGKHAFLNDKQFVGTELNKKRLGIVVDFIHKKIS